MKKGKIIYSQNVRSSFARKDVEALKREFDLVIFEFIPVPKIVAIPLLIKQFFILLYHIPGSVGTVSLFAGYHSFLPILFSKLFHKPGIIVLGGSDCVSLPSINYGNFNKPVQAFFTKWSLNLASHLAPVDSSLVLSEYHYTDTDYPKQGYKVFCPKADAAVTTIHFGYDSEMFQRTSEKIPNTFLTVGYLNQANFYRKGIDLIFDQAQRRPDCRYTVIGGTAANLPSGVNVPSNVTMLASVTYEELTEHYSSHQFYFQLSMMEGFPSAICEAMLCECVPIGSDVAAIPNIIGNAGYVLVKKDPDLLDELIEKALSEYDSNAGKKARQRIMDQYPKDERAKLLDLVKSEVEKFAS